MDEDLPDFTMCLPFPSLPEELPEDFAARIEAAIAAFQEQLRGEDAAVERRSPVA